MHRFRLIDWELKGSMRREGLGWGGVGWDYVVCKEGTKKEEEKEEEEEEEKTYSAPSHPTYILPDAAFLPTFQLSNPKQYPPRAHNEPRQRHQE